MGGIEVTLTVVQIANACLTSIIALAVAVVAYLQWRTAHNKIVLDLFDRRMRIYEQSVDLFKEVMREGVTIDPPKVIRFHHVRDEAAFLFGEDVVQLLKDWHEALIDMMSSGQMIKQGDSPDHSDHVKKAYTAHKKALSIWGQFPGLCQQYMKMDQRVA